MSATRVSVNHNIQMSATRVSVNCSIYLSATRVSVNHNCSSSVFVDFSQQSCLRKDAFNQLSSLMLICGDFLTDSYYDLDRQCQEDTGYIGSQACNVSPHVNNTS